MYKNIGLIDSKRAKRKDCHSDKAMFKINITTDLVPQIKHIPRCDDYTFTEVVCKNNYHNQKNTIECHTVDTTMVTRLTSYSLKTVKLEENERLMLKVQMPQ